MTKLIRNSTAEFLIFTSQTGEDSSILAEAVLTEATTSKMEAVQQEVERTVRYPISHKPSHQLSWSH